MRIHPLRFASAVAGAVVCAVLPSAAFAADAKTTTSSAPSSAQAMLAFVSFGTALLVILAGLFFSSSYHKRLMVLMHYAIKMGVSVSTISESAVDGPGDGAGTRSGQDAATTSAAGQVAVQGLDDGIKVLVPDKIEVGKRAVGKVVHLPANGSGAGVTWSLVHIDGTGPTMTWTGAEWEHTFTEAGTFNLTVSAAEQSVDPYVATLDVSAAPAPPSPPAKATAPTSSANRAGASLQALFAMRNWARFVIVIFGVGVVSALIFGKVISAEGGIGLLGALLGVGATTGPDPAPAASGVPPPPAPPAKGSAPAPAAGPSTT